MELNEYLFLKKQKELNDFRTAENLVLEELQKEGIKTDMKDFDLLITAALFVSKYTKKVTKLMQDNGEDSVLTMFTNIDMESDIDERMARHYIREVLKTIEE